MNFVLKAYHFSLPLYSFANTVRQWNCPILVAFADNEASSGEVDILDA